MSKDKQSFHEVASSLLEQNLKKFEKSALNLNTCTKIYQTIFETFVMVFQQSGVNVSNEAMNYIAQTYYDAITINDNSELDPNVFSQRAKLENIETSELALLYTMLQGTDFAVPLASEIKKRS